MDNMIFEKIWIDSNPVEDFFQLKITVNNDRITMSSEVYAQTPNMIEFEKGVRTILLEPFTVVMGNDDDSGIDCVKLAVTPDKRGVISVSVCMKSRSYNGRNDTANFTIQTDIASLDRFAFELKQISKGSIGTKVQLHDGCIDE